MACRLSINGMPLAASINAFTFTSHRSQGCWRTRPAAEQKKGQEGQKKGQKKGQEEEEEEQEGQAQEEEEGGLRSSCI